MHEQTPVTIITGASRGLGLEIARLLARRGAPLVLTARGAAALKAAAEAVRRHTEVLALAGDVGDPEHAARLVQAGLERFGRIDALVNNASLLGPSPMPALERFPVEALGDIFRVNVLGPLRLIQLALPGMKARGRGVIVNVTSDAVVQAYPGWGGYAASKAALEHVSRTLAVELEGSGVRVYWVDPGDMNTQMHQEAEPGVDLSHLPGPAVPAPAFVDLIVNERAPAGRFEALRRLEAGLVGA